MRTAPLRRTTIAIAACVAAMVAPQAARAHGNFLQSTTPADGASVAEPIDEVVAEYTQPPVIELATVTSPTGVDVAVEPAVRGTGVAMPIQLDEAGTWRLAWQVVQQDGHAVDYDIEFTALDSAVTNPVLVPLRDALVDIRAFVASLQLTVEGDSE